MAIEVNSGRKITGAEALRARRDMVYAQHQVGWRSTAFASSTAPAGFYDRDELGAPAATSRQS